MSKDTKFKIGDKIIDSSNVYKIYKIKKSKIINGDNVGCLFYKPLFKKDKSRSLICSVPESCIDDANLRRPVSKKIIDETLKLLGKRKNGEAKINIADTDEYIKENDPLQTARLLRLLWLEKQEEENTLSPRKKNLYKNTFRHLAEEVSVVYKISFNTAEDKIKKRLKKFYPQKEVKVDS